MVNKLLKRAGLVALLIGSSVLAQNPKVETTGKLSEKEATRRALVQKEAEYFELAAMGYLTAAQDRKEIVEEYEFIANQYIHNIEQGVETNFPAVWLTIAKYKKEIGRLEKQIGNNFLKAGSLFEKAHGSFLDIGINKVPLLERKKLLDYRPHHEKSREAYQVSLEYFNKAGDKNNAASVIELMASEDEETANVYRTLRKNN